jgi:hypothetical protein
VAIRVYSHSQGLASSEIWSITEDRKGRIYAGTARGVDRLDPANDRVTHYSHAEGIDGDIRSALCDRNGDLWFSSNRGLFRLRPDSDLPRRALVAKIVSVRVAGVAHPLSELGETNVGHIDVAWYRNSVEIEFSAMDFQAPEQLRYQFRLLGATGEWSEPTPNPAVHFSNLAPGSYQFLVRAINADGLTSPTPASFAYTISSPPWRRWWFQALAAALLAGLVYLWHRISMNRQLALERVRSRIATDLHDDIGASLARIAVMSEAVKDRVNAGDSDSQRMLANIAETSRSLVEGMGDIVWSIDPRDDNVGDVVARLRAFGSDVLETRAAFAGPAKRIPARSRKSSRRISAGSYT